ncbi:MAG: hypothetical protein ACQEVA_08520 [Myxococcota bacterium]
MPREDLGWERRDISRVFGRDEIEKPRPESVGHAPTPEKKSRVFRDVTQVNPTPVSRADDEHPPDSKASPGVAAPPAGEDQTDRNAEADATDDSLGARLRKLKGKRLDIPTLDDESEASAAPEPSGDALDAEFEAIVDEAASAVDEVSDGVENENENESESDNENENENENESESENETKNEPPYTIRVDNEVHEDLGLDAIAQLVRSGVWTEVVEVRTVNGDWIRLSNSSVMSELREHLAREAKSTLKLVASGEWEREASQPAGRESSPETVAEQTPPGPETNEPEIPEDDEDASTSNGAGTKVLLVMVAVFAIAAIVGVYQWQKSASVAGKTQAEVTDEATRPATPPAPGPSIDEKPADPFAAARAAVADAAAPARIVNSLANAGHYKAARHLAIDTWAADRDAPGLQAAFDRAITEDPALHPDVATLGDDVAIDRVFALGGGRSISFRMTNGGQTLYAFKPEQKEWGRGWRAELAAYLLCEVVVCQFEIPENRPARISRERFEKLYGLVETYRQTRYAERFDDLRWRKERGPDGEEREYLYGVLEAWVPEFVDWPIEYTSIWEDWLDVRYHPGVLEEPLVEELTPLQEKDNSSAYSSILSERGDATTRDVARQLSSMLLFDFLTSNWDRFSDVEAYYGVNNQFADGRFISLDLGAAFFDERINKVASRFDLVTRFSARTVASVRALSPEVLNPVLFPDPTSKEKYRLALFWTQHDEAVQRVDALIEKYGRDRVLEFE